MGVSYRHFGGRLHLGLRFVEMGFSGPIGFTESPEHRFNRQSLWLMVLVPLLRRTADGWILTILAIAIIIIGALSAWAHPFNAIWGLLLVGICVTLLLLEKRYTRIVVDGHFVEVRGLLDRTCRFSRSKIAGVEAWSYWIHFLDQSGNSIARIRPYWCRRQLEELSDFLGVPLILRRNWFEPRFGRTITYENGVVTTLTKSRPGRS